jgi:hypothetical protein
MKIYTMVLDDEIDKTGLSLNKYIGIDFPFAS